MKTLETPVMFELSHGLNFNEIPFTELVVLNDVILSVTEGKESIITILENLIDNSNDEESEELLELREKLLEYGCDIRY